MSIKRYFWDRLADCNCNIVERPDGAMVDYDGHVAAVAELEARCAALAEENAQLKAKSDDRRMFIMNGVQLGYIKVPTVETDPALETIRVAVSPQEPTPATDAFLAEVRAQGVDSAVETIMVHMNHQHVAVAEALHILRTHADQLRQGGAK